MRRRRANRAVAAQIKIKFSGNRHRGFLQRGEFFQRDSGTVQVELHRLLRRAIKHISGHSPCVAAEFGPRKSNFVVRQMQLAFELIEMKAFGLHIIQDKIPIQYRNGACSLAAKIAAQKSGDGVICAEYGLQISRGPAFHLGV